MGDTVTVLETHADISLDGAPVQPGCITIEQEIKTFASATATKPDPAWTLVDERGHFHAYDDDGELPTLTSSLVHVNCDDVHTGPLADPDEPCEGYDVTEWTCRICGTEITPGRLPDHDQKSMPGLKAWRAEITSDQPIDNRIVSVRAAVTDGVHFGAAYATMRRAETRLDGGLQVTIELIGYSPLGYRRNR